MERPFCREQELLEAAGDFEMVIRSSEKFCDASKRLSRLLSVFFAMKSAFAIRKSFCPKEGERYKATTCRVGGEADYVEQESLPSFETVSGATRKLVAAVEKNNEDEGVNALEEMGVFALCPVPNEQLSRMERFAGRVSGRARLVFLVELALFAVEQQDYYAAKKYVIEAWAFDPSSWELYNFCVLEGLFALSAGKTSEAVQYLEKSINACQVDEHASLNCGLRAPNFLLAQKLFERGERGAVLRYLFDCKNIWQWPRMPMDDWITQIENGETPDFQNSAAVRGMNQPSCRLDLQWKRARFLDEAEEPKAANANTKSGAEILAARKKLLEESERQIRAKVKKAIEYLDT
ncbi:MAG: hypothetical protein WA637_22595 [Terriglobales bacterium]